MPTWLTREKVAAWLTGQAATVAEPERIDAVIDSVEPFAEESRPEFRTEDGYEPDGEVMQGAVMLAARVLRRRNSPGGIENFSDGVVSYVARFDPEIERALRLGAWQQPRVG